MVHFYQFSSGSRRLPKELIVDEVDEMFLPSHQGILIPLKKNADAVRAFVEKLPVLFEHAGSSSNCLGSALKIVHELIADIGGRVTVFQASIPNLGPASLKSREDPNQRAANDVQNLGPVTDFYKCLALECTGHQVALDLFMLNSQYADLATLSEMAKFSTGCVYHFPNYHCLNDTVQVKRFEKILTRYLTRKIGFEAVLRIRCSRGLSLSAFYGNFFVRSTDLLALANVNPDSAIAVQVSMEEKLATTVCFQAALLYTSSKGDRRIRVHTMCLPTTADLAQVYNNFDLKATVSLIAKIGVDRSMTGSSLADCREAIVNAVVDSLGAYHKTMRQGRPGGVLVPRKGHLRTSFCAGRSVKLDDRVASMLMLRFCPLEQILSEFYPQLYRLNEILQLEDGRSAHHLYLCHREGIYLIEAGSAIYLYFSSHSDVQLIQDLFGCPYSQVDEQSFRIHENPFSEKVHAFVRHVTALKFYLGPVILVKEDSAIREDVMRRFVDDRSESTHSYVEFLQHIKREISNT
ncbi:Sec23/Sec24 beta-sandwich domain protein [Ostertagia ostertagi]